MHFFQLHLAWSLAGFLATEALAQTPPLEQAARAILEAHCLTCHGAARMSGLDLRQRETLLKGIPRVTIVPGKPEEGLLYRYLSVEPATSRCLQGSLHCLSRIWLCWVDAYERVVDRCLSSHQLFAYFNEALCPALAV